MKTIHLHGHLGDTFGREFRLDVFSPAEAIRALEANFPGRFYQVLKDGEYHVVKGKSLDTAEDCALNEFGFGLGAKDLHIIPAIAGSCGGGGFFQVALGVALIGAAIFTAGAAAGPAFGLMEGIAAGSMTATTFMGISMAGYAAFGTAMLIGGISAMLAPTMSLPGSGTRAAVDPRASFVFQGPENISAQGGPVQVTYGTFLVGSTVVSASITIERL